MKLPWGFNYTRINLQNATNFCLRGRRKDVAPVSSVRPTLTAALPLLLCRSEVGRRGRNRQLEEIKMMIGEDGIQTEKKRKESGESDEEEGTFAKNQKFKEKRNAILTPEVYFTF